MVSFQTESMWEPYRLAVHDMVSRTSSPIAPWTTVAANDKRRARVQVLETGRRRCERERMIDEG